MSSRPRSVSLAIAVVLGLLAVMLVNALPAPSAEALTLGTTQKFFVNGISHDGSINGVHCSPAVGAVPAGCVSVGTNEGNQKPIVVVGEGASQTASYADADGGRHWLSDVWCSNSQRCIAVGYADTTTGNHPYIMDFNNGTWTRVANIDPVDYSSTSGRTSLTTLSCTDIDNCVAVGFSQAASTASPANVTRPIAFSKIAGTWSSQYVLPNTAVLTTSLNPSTARLTAVECVSASKCYAAGTYGISSGTAIKPFVATGTVSGGAITWTTTEIGLANFGSFPFGNTPFLSCASANYCVAAGQYSDTSSVNTSFFFEMTNGTWAANAIVSDLNPTDRLDVAAIDCPADGVCYLPAGTNQGLSGAVITLTNGTPTFQFVTKAGAQAGFLNTIDCPNASSCAIGGSYQDPSAQYNIVLGSLENGVWSINATYPSLNDPNSNPAWVQYDSYFNTDTSLSCRTDGQCLAGSSNRANNAWRATLTNFSIAISSPPSSSTTSTTQAGGSSTSSTVVGSPSTTAPVTVDVLRSLPEGRLINGPVRRGGSIVARWGGFPAGTNFNLWISPGPVLLGSGVVDSDGYVTINGTVPNDVAAGTQTIALLSEDGTMGVQNQYTFDSSGNALPYTGSDSKSMVLFAGLLVGTGVVLAFVARRRLVLR